MAATAKLQPNQQKARQVPPASAHAATTNQSSLEPTELLEALLNSLDAGGTVVPEGEVSTLTPLKLIIRILLRGKQAGGVLKKVRAALKRGVRSTALNRFPRGLLVPAW